MKHSTRHAFVAAAFVMALGCAGSAGDSTDTTALPAPAIATAEADALRERAIDAELVRAGLDPIEARREAADIARDTTGARAARLDAFVAKYGAIAKAVGGVGARAAAAEIQ